MDLFWLEETDIPEDAGFTLFGTEHIKAVVPALISAGTLAFIYCRQRKLRKVILAVISILLPLIEISKIIFLQRAGHFGIGHLPLHLCSLSIILYPLYTIIKPGRIRDFLGEFGCLILLPAGIGALLFPDWTMYPVISFMSLSSFAWHTLQITLPLCIIFAGEIDLKPKSILCSTAFLLLVTIPVYLFDRHFSCNYFFLLRPVPGPLETVYEKFGITGYLPALAILVILIILITYTVIHLLSHRRSAENPTLP
ncbi:MAG: YwaF family protein [Lachnospiraceae bacterium]|nr:YwaF family protein [Lachnospiraceae bacterium]